MPNFLRNVPKIEARAAVSSLTIAVGLLMLKFVAYFLTNSSAIFSDALESIANVAAAGFALYALYQAHRPADADHPYGHGKIEFLAAGFEGSMILTAALVAVLRSVDAMLHILRHQAELNLENLHIGVGLLLIAVVVNGVTGLSLIRIGRRTGSPTLEADGHHLFSDAITSVAAIAGLVVLHITHWNYADPVAALVVAAYIGAVGWRFMRGAVGGLMDEQDQTDEIMLRTLLDAHVGPTAREPHICSYHKLRHRHSGRYHWVDFHVVVPPNWDIRRGHQVASDIEDEIEAALGIGNATAHIEPCNGIDCRLCAGESAQPIQGIESR